MKKKIVFEEGSKCTNIGQQAFFYSTSLRKVTFPESLVSVGSEAFYWTDKLEEIVARCEAELKAVQEEETAILKENIGLATELDAAKAQRAALNAAAAELRAVFEKELDLARKAKSKLSRNNEYLNR